MKNKKIAVVGVSKNPSKYGYRIFNDLLNNGYAVYGVNINNGELFGQKLYRSLEEIPEKIDIAIMVVPPEVTKNVLQECHLLGINEVWMQPGSESIEAINIAKSYRIKYHTSCFMVDHGIW